MIAGTEPVLSTPTARSIDGESQWGRITNQPPRLPVLNETSQKALKISQKGISLREASYPRQNRLPIRRIKEVAGRNDLVGGNTPASCEPNSTQWPSPSAVSPTAPKSVLEALPDEDIDTSDIPEGADWSDAVRGKFYRPVKKETSD